MSCGGTFSGNNTAFQAASYYYHYPVALPYNYFPPYVYPNLVTSSTSSSSAPSLNNANTAALPNGNGSANRNGVDHSDANSNANLGIRPPAPIPSSRLVTEGSVTSIAGTSDSSSSANGAIDKGNKVRVSSELSNQNVSLKSSESSSLCLAEMNSSKKVGKKRKKCNSSKQVENCNTPELNLKDDPNYPNPRDVICARGAESRFHPGNKRFRDIIDQYCEGYMNAPKSERQLYTKKIVKMIHDSGGRFMKRGKAEGVPVSDDESCEWYEIDARSSREKVSQSLREKGAMCMDRKKMLSEEPHSEQGMLLKIQGYLFEQSLKKLESSEPSHVSPVHN